MKVFCFIIGILLISQASGQKLLSFDMRRDRIELRHFRGGKSLSWVKKELNPDAVFVAGFYGWKTFNGVKLKCGVDLTIENGVQKIGPHFKNRKVLAVYKNGKIEIYPDAETCLKAGIPESAVAGMTIPPQPKEKLRRNIIAIKGYIVHQFQFFGNHKDCLRYIQACGYDKFMHFDGGSSLNKGVIHPSQVLVYRDAFPATTLVASR